MDTQSIAMATRSIKIGTHAIDNLAAHRVGTATHAAAIRNITTSTETRVIPKMDVTQINMEEEPIWINHMDQPWLMVPMADHYPLVTKT